jgi:hypothetical protein
MILFLKAPDRFIQFGRTEHPVEGIDNSVHDHGLLEKWAFYLYNLFTLLSLGHLRDFLDRLSTLHPWLFRYPMFVAAGQPHHHGAS